jgi:molybdate transport system permease protein
MSHEQWQLIGFTASMAGISTLLVLPLGLALAWCLARPQWKGKPVLETIVTLPLVLPPVVTGLFLLQMLGRRGPWAGGCTKCLAWISSSPGAQW